MRGGRDNTAVLATTGTSLPVPFPAGVPSIVAGDTRGVVPDAMKDGDLQGGILVSIFLGSVLSLVFSVLVLFVSLVYRGRSFPLLQLDPVLAGPWSFRRNKAVFPS